MWPMLEFHKVDPSGKEWTLRILCRLSDGGCVERSDILYSRGGPRVRTETLQSGELDFVEGWEEEVFSELARVRFITLLVTNVQPPWKDRKWAGTTYRPERVCRVRIDSPWDDFWYPEWSWPNQKKYEARCGRERLAAKERLAISRTKAGRKRSLARTTGRR
jgi:hypothetical protein